MAIANMDHNGRNGVLSLVKDQYYWVTPSAAQAGWLLGHNGDGKTGRILEVSCSIAEACGHCHEQSLVLLERSRVKLALHLIARWHVVASARLLRT